MKAKKPFKILAGLLPVREILGLALLVVLGCAKEGGDPDSGSRETGSADNSNSSVVVAGLRGASSAWDTYHHVRMRGQARRVFFRMDVPAFLSTRQIWPVSSGSQLSTLSKELETSCLGVDEASGQVSSWPVELIREDDVHSRLQLGRIGDEIWIPVRIAPVATGNLASTSYGERVIWGEWVADCKGPIALIGVLDEIGSDRCALQKKNIMTLATDRCEIIAENMSLRDFLAEEFISSRGSLVMWKWKDSLGISTRGSRVVIEIKDHLVLAVGNFVFKLSHHPEHRGKIVAQMWPT